MKHKTFWITLVCGVVCVVVGTIGVWYVTHSSALMTSFAHYALQATQSDAAPAAALVPTLLGFDRPHTTLVLFLNNTELRPGGGFIGSYGVVTVNRGTVENLLFSATDGLDHNALSTFVVEPPAPIKTYLAQPRWFFRDANWSPDFAVSAARELQFYSAEGGVHADQIDTVVGITPEVVQTLLAFTGPITVRGNTYTADNVRDLLEYTVEVDYLHKQISPDERKAVMGELAMQIIARLKHIAPTKWGPLISALMNRARSGQLMMYDVHPDVQHTIESLGWGGRQVAGKPDYLMVVDANLASLKTDRVMKRGVRYEIFRDNTSGEWRARVTLTYTNTGAFDWRTTRYRTYTRVYFPLGTKFLSGTGSMKKEKSIVPAPWDVSEEAGHMVVGTFFAVEPGETKQVTVEVALAQSVVAALQSGQYGLLVQKELGVPNFELTVHDKFDTTVGSAAPAETPNNFGDQYYDWSGDVSADMTFALTV